MCSAAMPRESLARARQQGQAKLQASAGEIAGERVRVRDVRVECECECGSSRVRAITLRCHYIKLFINNMCIYIYR